MRGLYVHIPFCVKKCSYCDFYSLPARQDSVESYIEAVIQEARLYSGMSFETLYIGGGTPSLLGAKHLQQLINGLKKTLNFEYGNPNQLPEAMQNCRPESFSKDEGSRSVSQGDSLGTSYPKKDSATLGLVEATIEVNPESATREFLEAVKDTGFNRVSFGVQSLSGDELRSVGRIHTAEQAIEAIKLAKSIGFEAISADLIIGLPGQTWTSLRKALKTLVELGVKHLSVYCLSLEEGTFLRNNPPANLPSDDMQAKLYEKTRKFLNTCGCAHYEISNWAVRGYECQHNLNYWRGGEYLGLGAAAASHLEGKRFKNKADMDAYIWNPAGQIEGVEELGKEEKAAEETMLRLRLLEEGVAIIELEERYGGENVEGIVRRLEGMAEEGLLIGDGARYRLSGERVLTCNGIFVRLISG